MQPWSVREFHADDLDQIISVWQASRTDGARPVYSLTEIIEACSNDLAVVAAVQGRVVGAAACRIQEDRAWIFMLAQAPTGAGRASEVPCSPVWNEG
ncbi:hypothetical protein [Arthrobacter sp. UYEF20]|uniref:hypothetical protein n=1 Tax=Arthrobacter sp. UYEF20 TaxID=1756363 RepID=UPI0033930C72